MSRDSRIVHGAFALTLARLCERKLHQRTPQLSEMYQKAAVTVDETDKFIIQEATTGKMCIVQPKTIVIEIATFSVVPPT